MVRCVLLSVALCWTASAAGASNAVSLGYSDKGAVIDSDAESCPGGGWLVANHDGTFENGYAWQYAGIQPPYYGAFGEGIEGFQWTVACVALWVSTEPGYFSGQTCDVYIWDGGVDSPPTSVLGMVAGVVLGNVPVWPMCGENDVWINMGVHGDFTVGYWGNWPGGHAAYYCGADLSGSGGHPWTWIAPGVGYPTGWNDPSIVWGPTRSMGCGAWFAHPASVEARSWGSIKALFE